MALIEKRYSTTHGGKTHVLHQLHIKSYSMNDSRTAIQRVILTDPSGWFIKLSPIEVREIAEFYEENKSIIIAGIKEHELAELIEAKKKLKDEEKK